MSEETLGKEIIETKKKISGLKNDIKKAKGPGASKIQAGAQESIGKLEVTLKQKEEELKGLTIPEVTEKEVLQMIEVAATSEEVGEIEDGFEGEIPDGIKEALEDRKQELSAEPKNLKTYPELRWKKTTKEEVADVQKEDLEIIKKNPKDLHKCRLVGYDEKRGVALIKPKVK